MKPAALRALALALAPACATTPTPPPPAAEAPAPAAETPKPMPPPEIAFLTLPSSQNPIVTFRWLFRAGSADDPAGMEGATALAARLMAEGGTEKLSSYELQQALFPWAARIGVQVDKELTVFTARVHRDHLDPFLAILADVIMRPRWDASEFERMRRDATDDIEKRLRASDDENLGKEALNLLLFTGHPYGHYDGGTVQALKAMTLEGVKQHARAVFNRRRLTVGIAGGWPEDLPARIAKALEALPDGPPAQAIPEAGAGIAGVRLLIVEKEAPAVAVSMGYPYGLTRRDDDFHAVAAATSAFGEHRQFHGRLFTRLRELRGLNYGDYAYAEFFAQEGWSTFALTNVARARQQYSLWLRPVGKTNVEPAGAPDFQRGLFALRAAVHEYRKLFDEGLTADEVKFGAGFLAGYTRLWEKNDDRRLGYALDDAWYGTSERLARYRDALAALSPEAVQAALKRHLRPWNALRIAVVVKDAQAFRDAVLANAPSPIAYDAQKPAELLEEDKTIAALSLDLKPEEVRIVKADDLFER